MWSRRTRSLVSASAGTLLSFILVLGGCTPHPPPVLPPPAPVAFPPQKAMESGNYAEFLAENERALRDCVGQAGCDVALFNLGFTYAYSLSPYRNPTKALEYFSELTRKYPRSPWAFQGQAWTALIKENLVAEESQRQLQTNLRNREATIRSLRAQLNRSRAIDVEIEKKERELLR
jgi:TPR repeat protein